MWWIIGGVLLAGLTAAGPVMSHVEQPAYMVVRAEKTIEIRTYAPQIAAEVTVTGERDVAINQGFERLADYIFGNNTQAGKIAMTAPVVQQPAGEKIAMTAPVLQYPEGNAWRVRFIMPASYTMETLPVPNDASVKLIPLPEQNMAVIRFSGRASTESLIAQTAALRQFINDNALQSEGEPLYAFYNPPWTLPFLRRNEVMLALKPESLKP